MKLLVLFICFTLQYYLGFHREGKLAWLSQYALFAQKKLEPWSQSPFLGIALLTLPLILTIALLSIAFHEVWFNSLSFLFNVVILLFCLDVRNAREQLQQYFNAAAQNETQATFRYGAEFLAQSKTHSRTNDLVSVIRGITTQLFSHADKFIFSVIFWYVLTGITGAATYAILTYFVESACFEAESWKKAASRLQQYIDWLPSRLTGFTYALMGHFSAGFQYWRQNLLTYPDQIPNFALNVGMAALELDPEEEKNRDLALADTEENKKGLDLIHRTIILWIVVIALLTVIAWIE